MRRFMYVLVLCAGSGTAFAGSPDFSVSCGLNPNCQSDFRGVTEDITAVAGFKALTPAEATGVTGFGVGAYGAYAPTQHKQAWNNLTGSDVSGIGIAIRNSLNERCSRAMWRAMSTRRPSRISQTS